MTKVKQPSKMDLEKIIPKNGPPINEVSKYIEKYKDDLICLKYGGNIFLDRSIFISFIEDLSILNKLGIKICVIHGGGPRIQKELEKSNIQSKFIRGLRVTDEKIIDIVENVLIDFNNDIVSSLEKMAQKQLGSILKNNVIEVLRDAPELGFVGTPNKINNEIILKIIKDGKIPIISPLGLQENQAFNINGDVAAGKIAQSLKCRRLLLMTNVEGVLDQNK